MSKGEGSLTKKQAKFLAAWEYDQALRIAYGSLICGIDEAGRGPLAGPVVAAAVILPENLSEGPFYDSKQLTARERERAFAIILEQAIAFGIGIVDPEYIDQYNILQATYEAMRKAIASLKVSPAVLLVDGAIIPQVEYPQLKLVRGDSLSQSIGAASILAKVTRDRMMVEWDKRYPEYGFARHVGYGTALHLDALRRFGPTPLHRRSFGPVRSIIEASNDVLEPPVIHHTGLRDRVLRGKSSEDLAIAWLQEKGLWLRDRNWRVHGGEIDAVMVDNRTLVFVEVRSRQRRSVQQSLMEAAESVNVEKQERLRRLAQWYISSASLRQDMVVRFDVILVAFSPSGEPVFEHYENAF